MSQYGDVIWSQKYEDEGWLSFHLRDVGSSLIGSGLRSPGARAGGGWCIQV